MPAPANCFAESPADLLRQENIGIAGALENLSVVEFAKLHVVAVSLNVPAIGADRDVVRLRSATAMCGSRAVHWLPAIDASRAFDAIIRRIEEALEAHAQVIVFEIGAAVEPAELVAVTMQPIALVLSSATSV